MTHGAVDGYSRMIPYLHCATNNSASTVLNLFVQGSMQYGLPTMTRSDHGGENIKVALLMNLIRGTETQRTHHITGKSTHNQRIERMWRDVHQQVTKTFYEEFYSMEEDMLNVDEPIHLFALQYVYEPIINNHLNIFRVAWNNHKLRTAGHRSPEQIWIDGMLEGINGSHTAVTEHFDPSSSLAVSLETSISKYGLNLANHTTREDITEVAVVVPETGISLPNEMRVELENSLAGVTDRKQRVKIAVDKLTSLYV